MFLFPVCISTYIYSYHSHSSLLQITIACTRNCNAYFGIGLMQYYSFCSQRRFGWRCFVYVLLFVLLSFLFLLQNRRKWQLFCWSTEKNRFNICFGFVKNVAHLFCLDTYTIIKRFFFRFYCSESFDCNHSCYYFGYSL